MPSALWADKSKYAKEAKDDSPVFFDLIQSKFNSYNRTYLKG